MAIDVAQGGREWVEVDGVGMIEVVLTDLELGYLIPCVAMQRDEMGKKAHADNAKYGHKGDSLETHEVGCKGECACAKGLNVYWSGAGQDFHHDTDVSGYLVRLALNEYSRKGYPASLIVRPAEKYEPDAIWIMVIQRDDPNTFLVRGWIYDADARQEQWLRAPNGREAAYFVPQDALEPMDTLPSREP